MMTLCPTTANFPGKPYMIAVNLAQKMHSDWAQITHHYMQLCPQQLGALDSETAQIIVEAYPQTQFRCHANVRLNNQLFVFDATNDLSEIETANYVAQLKRINNILGATAYTYHAGRCTQSLSQMAANVYRLQDMLDIQVGVEGLYPSNKEDWQLSSWADYEWLLHSGLDYAIDVSHLQIVAQHEKTWQLQLVKELLYNKHCIEIHVAGNDGIHDNHQTVSGREEWHKFFNDNNFPGIIFTEENYVRRQQILQKMNKG